MKSKGKFASLDAKISRSAVRKHLRKLYVFFLTSALLISVVISAYAAQVTLSWDTVNEPDVAGYKLHYGEVAGIYTNSIDTGKTTSSTLFDLVEGKTYYFAATSYDSNGNQSGYSNEVSKAIPSGTNYSMVVSTNGTGTGTVSGSGISCGSVCSGDFSPGTVVTLTATPASGSTFAGWSGACSGTGNCTVAMNTSASVTATFNSTTITYDITATAKGSGTITAVSNPNVFQGISGDTNINVVKVTKGANQIFTIVPSTGNYTASVSVDGTVVAKNVGNYSYTFSSVSAAHTIDAIFAPIAGKAVLAINCGGSSFVDSAGVNYKADSYFDGGNASSDTKNISGTLDDRLYQDWRSGSFSYNIPLASGNYSLTLKFADNVASSNRRVFDVLAEGIKVISGLDIVAKVGKNAAYDVTIPVSISDGILNILFKNIIGYAKVNAIVIEPR